MHYSDYTILYSERAFFGLSESVIHVNGTQIFANLDFREVCLASGHNPSTYPGILHRDYTSLSFLMDFLEETIKVVVIDGSVVR